MDSRIRFPRTLAVYEAFPDLSLRVPPPETDCPPLEHARRLLSSPRPKDAIVFLAHLLPRREAVWWARQCVAGLLGPNVQDDGLRAADLWVKDPDEETRQVARKAGVSGDFKLATTWLARAAAWSGGSMLPPESDRLAAPASACAQAVNAAIILAATRVGDPKGVMKRIVACAEAGIRFAEGEEARLTLSQPTGKRVVA